LLIEQTGKYIFTSRLYTDNSYRTIYKAISFFEKSSETQSCRNVFRVSHCIEFVKVPTGKRSHQQPQYFSKGTNHLHVQVSPTIYSADLNIVKDRSGIINTIFPTEKKQRFDCWILFSKVSIWCRILCFHYSFLSHEIPFCFRYTAIESHQSQGVKNLDGNRFGTFFFVILNFISTFTSL
jgi:hypothetical protein